MKDEVTIQRAHDLLNGLRELPIETISIIQLFRSHESLNVLCWMLDHNHNTAFAEFLFDLEASLAAKGIRLVDSGKLNYPDGNQKRQG